MTIIDALFLFSIIVCIGAVLSVVGVVAFRLLPYRVREKIKNYHNEN